MVHLRPLPGSPGFRAPSLGAASLAEIEDHALADAAALRTGGADVVLIENMADLPYLRGRVDPETVAAAAILARAVQREANLPAGIQLLAGANREALGVALAARLQFIRAEGFAYGHLADEGWMDACAGPLLRTRAALHAESIQVFTDIRKKHSAHACTSDLSLADLAHGTQFCGADGLIVTGPATGCPTAIADLREVREAVPDMPLLVGSGVTPEQIPELAKFSDGLIVGTWIKQGGDWRQPVSVERVAALREALDRAASHD
jgi:membrane complex biogenesis BtpA family protein